MIGSCTASTLPQRLKSNIFDYLNISNNCISPSGSFFSFDWSNASKLFLDSNLALVPSKTVIKVVDEIISLIGGGKFVGVHLRLGDYIYWCKSRVRKSEHFKCCPNIESISKFYFPVAVKACAFLTECTVVISTDDPNHELTKLLVSLLRGRSIKVYILGKNNTFI